MTRKHKLIFAIVVLVIFAGFSLYENVISRQNVYVLSEISPNQLNETDSPSETASIVTDVHKNPDEKESLPATIVVHIEGQVHYPGVYELEEGARVNDLVQLAGGLTAEADRRLNLAQKLHDEVFVYVMAVDEEMSETPSFQPVISFQGGSTAEASSLVNINTADQKALETLPGIGPVLAQRIIDYRQQHGPFKEISDLKKVTGIGDKRFEDIESSIMR